MEAIRHMGIVITNKEKSLHFYRDLLGLKIVKELGESGNYIETVCGIKGVEVNTIKMSANDGGLIELLLFKSHPGKIDPNRDLCSIGPTHIAFSVKNLDEEYKKLISSGVEFVSPPQISPDGYAKVAFCKDPDGTPIELVEVL